MDRREYCRQLTQELRHLTPDEIAAVRQELWDHMEDHAEMLREAGYDEAEANERAVEAMGDPVETGREIDKQYPPVWLWLNRIAKAVIVVVCISIVFNALGMLTAFESLRLRNDPYHFRDIPEEARIDYYMEVGSDIVHFIGLENYIPGQDCEASLYFDVYDRNIFSPVDQNLSIKLAYYTDSGEADSLSGGSYSREGLSRDRRNILLKAEDTYLTAVYDHFGRYVECTIDLAEVGK